MPEWNTRLSVVVRPASGPAVDVTPIDSFSPTFSLNAEPIHSLERTHVGVIYNPRAVTFSMTVKAIGPAVARLTELALKGALFNIELQESNDGADWSFQSVVLNDCVITSAQPTTATIAGAPSAVFSGFSLASTATDKAGLATSIP